MSKTINYFCKFYLVFNLVTFTTHDLYSFTIQPYLSYLNQINSSEDKINYGSAKVMIPIYGDQYKLLSIDLNKRFFNDTEKKYNSVGLIFRNQLNDYNIGGINFYLDNEKISDNNFYQSSLGLELLNKTYELKANFYQLFKREDKQINNLKYEMMNGFDVQAGIKLNKHFGIYGLYIKNYNDTENYSGKGIKIENQFNITDNIKSTTRAKVITFNDKKQNDISLEMMIRIGLGGTYIGKIEDGDDKYETFEELIFKEVERHNEISFSVSPILVEVENLFIDPIVQIIKNLPFTAYFKAKDGNTETDKKYFNKLELINVDDSMLDIQAIQNKINSLGENVLILFETRDLNGNEKNKVSEFIANNPIQLKNGQYLVGDGYQFKVKSDSPTGQCSISSIDDCIINQGRNFDKNNPTMKLKIEGINLNNPAIKLSNNTGIIGMNIEFNNNTPGNQADKLDRDKHDYLIELKNSTKNDTLNIQDNLFTNNSEKTSVFEIKNDCSSTAIGQQCPNPLQLNISSFSQNPIKFYNNDFVLNAKETTAINTDWQSKFGLRENSFKLNNEKTNGINLDSKFPLGGNQSGPFGLYRITINQLTNTNGEGNSFTQGNSDSGLFSIENFDSTKQITDSTLFGNDITNFSWNGNVRQKLEIYKGQNLAGKLSNSNDSIIFLSQSDMMNFNNNTNSKNALIHQLEQVSNSQAKLGDNLIVLSNNDKMPSVNIQASYKGSPMQIKFHDIGIPWDLKTSIDEECTNSNSCNDSCNDKNLFDYSATKKSMIELNTNNIISGVDFIYSKTQNKTKTCDIPLSALQSNDNSYPDNNNAFIFDIKNTNSYLQNTNIKVEIGDDNINFIHLTDDVNDEFKNNTFAIKVPNQTNPKAGYNIDSNESDVLNKLLQQQNMLNIQ